MKNRRTKNILGTLLGLASFVVALLAILAWLPLSGQARSSKYDRQVSAAQNNALLDAKLKQWEQSEAFIKAVAGRKEISIPALVDIKPIPSPPPLARPVTATNYALKRENRAAAAAAERERAHQEQIDALQRETAALLREIEAERSRRESLSTAQAAALQREKQARAREERERLDHALMEAQRKNFTLETDLWRTTGRAPGR